MAQYAMLSFIVCCDETNNKIEATGYRGDERFTFKASVQQHDDGTANLTAGRFDYPRSLDETFEGVLRADGSILGTTTERYWWFFRPRTTQAPVGSSFFAMRVPEKVMQLKPSLPRVEGGEDFVALYRTLPNSSRASKLWRYAYYSIVIRHRISRDRRATVTWPQLASLWQGLEEPHGTRTPARYMANWSDDDYDSPRADMTIERRQERDTIFRSFTRTEWQFWRLVWKHKRDITPKLMYVPNQLYACLLNSHSGRRATHVTAVVTIPVLFAWDVWTTLLPMQDPSTPWTSAISSVRKTTSIQTHPQ